MLQDAKLSKFKSEVKNSQVPKLFLSLLLDSLLLIHSIGFQYLSSVFNCQIDLVRSCNLFPVFCS